MGTVGIVVGATVVMGKFVGTGVVGAVEPTGVVIPGVVGPVDGGGSSAVSQADGRSPPKLLQTIYSRYFDASAL